MALVGLLALVGSFMLGLVALAVVVGLGLLAGLVFWARVAWISRRLRKHAEEMGDRPQDSASESEFIETEYTVVSRRRDS
jgi:hypothetical protein